MLSWKRAKTRKIRKVPGAPPHCTSASVFQTTSILFFLSLMKISLQLHTLFLNSWLRTFAKIENKNLTSNFFTFSRKHAKSRTTAENIAYRTNQLPVGAQVFAPTACNPTISKILLPVVNFTERKRIKSRTRFSAKSTQNLKKCMKSTHFLIAFFNILAPFWHCRVTPYSGENLSLLLHTSEPRSFMNLTFSWNFDALPDPPSGGGIYGSPLPWIMKMLFQ